MRKLLIRTGYLARFAPDAPCDAMPGNPAVPCAEIHGVKLGHNDLWQRAGAQSPCVRDCCLGDDLTCLGCFRSLDEIREWSLADEARRRVILELAAQRRAAYHSSTETR